MIIMQPLLRAISLAALVMAFVSGLVLAQDQPNGGTTSATPAPFLKGRFLVGATGGPVVTIDQDLGNLYKIAPAVDHVRCDAFSVRVGLAVSLF